MPGGDFFGRAGNGADIADQVSADLAHASDGAREVKIETRRKNGPNSRLTGRGACNGSQEAPGAKITPV